MNPSNWFLHNTGLIFLIYGTTYVIIATAVLGHNKKDSEYGLAGILWYFAAYAILHAPGDFIDMLISISGGEHRELKLAGVLLTYLSYALLFEFGRRALRLVFPGSFFFRPFLFPVLAVLMLAVSFYSGDFRGNFDMSVGYAIRFPGGLMAGTGMILFYRNLPGNMKVKHMGKYFYSFGTALVLWAFFCGIVRSGGFVFPTSSINIESFFRITHVPVYVFRSLCGLTAAWSILGILNLFNHEKQERVRSALEGERNVRSYLARVIANITDPLIVTDSEGRITTMNTALISMIGRGEDGFRGEHIRTIIHPEDWERRIFPAIRMREAFEGEVRFMKSDGETIPAVYSITPIINEDEGIVDGFVGIAKETGVRKRIEAALNSMAAVAGGAPGLSDPIGPSNDTFSAENAKRNVADLALLDSYVFLQSIIDSVNDEVIVRNRENAVVMMNHAARKRMRDHDRADACCVNVFGGSSFPCDDCGTGSLISAVKEAGKTVFFERSFTLSGIQRIFEISASPLYGDGGAIIGIVEAGRDVTERRALELDVLKVYETERQRIGQDLHDDLMQNLIGIDVLLKMASNTMEQKYMTDTGFDDDSARLKEITHFLGNTISKSRRLARGLCPVNLDCDGFLPSIRQMAEETAGIYGIECDVIIDIDMPAIDDMTAIHMYYIIREAVTNAAKHSGAKRVDVAFMKEEDGFVISVRDNGIGCGDPATCGDGLGMRIMKYRADIIGSRLTIESAPTGTVVTCVMAIRKG